MKCKKCGLPIHIQKPGVEAGFCSVECVARHLALYGPPVVKDVIAEHETIDTPVKKSKKKKRVSEDESVEVALVE